MDKFWLEEGYAPSHARERALPTGTTGLIFNLLNDEMRVFDRQDPYRPRSFREALICGAHSGYFVIDTARRTGFAGALLVVVGVLLVCRTDS